MRLFPCVKHIYWCKTSIAIYWRIKGRKFYNDSKATNILATKNALAAFNEPTILLAGGLDRGNEFDELIPSFKNVKAMITFGQTAEKIGKGSREGGNKNDQTCR